MDKSSQSVMQFLSSLQVSMDRLQEFWAYLTEEGIQASHPRLVLSGRPFRVHGDGISPERLFNGCVALAVIANGKENKEIDLGLNIAWNDSGWTIYTEAWIEDDDGGQELISELPVRNANDLETCIREIDLALRDLYSFKDIIKEK